MGPGNYNVGNEPFPWLKTGQIPRKCTKIASEPNFVQRGIHHELLKVVTLATLSDPNSARVICFLRLILWKDRWCLRVLRHLRPFRGCPRHSFHHPDRLWDCQIHLRELRCFSYHWSCSS